MLTVLAQSVMYLGSLALLIAALSPVYMVAVYSVARPFLQPFAFLQYKFFGLPISISFSLIVITVGTGYIVLRSKWRFLTEYTGFYNAFLVVSVLSIGMSYDLRSSIEALVKLLTIWFVFNIALNAIKDFKSMNIILKGVMMSSIMPILFGFYQYFTGFSYSWGGKNAVYRVHSVLDVSNSYGIFLSILMIATLIGILSSKERRTRILLGLLMVLLLVSQVISLNRGTWIALSAGFIVAAFKYRRYMKLKWIVILVLFMTIFFSKAILDRFNELSEPENFSGQNTFEGRILYWKAITPLIMERPILGYGLGTADSVTAKNLGTDKPPHNDYVRIALETGIVGALLYLLFLLRLLLYFYTRPVSANYWVYNFPLIMLTVYFLIISVAQNITYNLINFPAFLIMVAVGIRANKLLAAEGLSAGSREMSFVQLGNDSTLKFIK